MTELCIITQHLSEKHSISLDQLGRLGDVLVLSRLVLATFRPRLGLFPEDPNLINTQGFACGHCPIEPLARQIHMATPLRAPRYHGFDAVDNQISRRVALKQWATSAPAAHQA